MNLYTKTLELDPDNRVANSKVYSNRATVLSKLGKHEEAVGDCDKALEADPNFYKVYLRRADSLMKLERFEDAVRDYEKALTMDRQNPGITF
jgi:DnaJ family protein C protein 7